MHKNPGIVAVGLYRPGTGFTRVFESLFEHLKSKFDIHWVGIGYKGNKISKGFTIHPCNREGGDMFGGFLARKIADQIDAKIIWFLNDFWMIKNYNISFGDSGDKFFKCAYVPLDGEITSLESVGDLSILDHLIVYTEFAHTQVNKIFTKNDIAPPNISIIPHGVDLTAFKDLKLNLSERILLKKQIFTNYPISSSTFILLNANRYSVRKDIESTLKGFANFLQKSKRDALLCLHQPGIKEGEKQVLIEMMRQLKIEKQCVINPFGDGNYIKDTELNKLYNACDVGINSSLGEGWGLISFEHAATKKPQIVPKHTACGELWKDHGNLLTNLQPVNLHNNPFRMYKSDPESISHQLMLLNNKEVYNKYAESAYLNAHQSKYNWKNISKTWEKLFSKISKPVID